MRAILLNSKKKSKTNIKNSNCIYVHFVTLLLSIMNLYKYKIYGKYLLCPEKKHFAVTSGIIDLHRVE